MAAARWENAQDGHPRLRASPGSTLFVSAGKHAERPVLGMVRMTSPEHGGSAQIGSAALFAGRSLAPFSSLRSPDDLDMTCLAF